MSALFPPISQIAAWMRDEENAEDASDTAKEQQPDQMAAQAFVVSGSNRTGSRIKTKLNSAAPYRAGGIEHGGGQIVIMCWRAGGTPPFLFWRVVLPKKHIRCIR
jgi:hypothetical protein